ncbi:hypothetical protein BGZ63DRAFT_429592 [Mariannaea sp. PMI_226]|nr:hypothetical protein BGZ63DRAFT_429592 [Mariannaea sp. PMI_226]
MHSNCTGTARRLQRQFPGLAALVNFFRRRRESPRSIQISGYSPTGAVWPDTGLCRLRYVEDLLSRVASGSFLLFRKYRLDDRMRIVAGPIVMLQKYHKERLLLFDLENMHMGKILSTTQVPRCSQTEAMCIMSPSPRP